ncbi:unnamed protein product, partial [Polarella glacialis]
ADNVLKPGAPLFLWQVCAKGGGFDTEVVSLREFAMPVEDWMSVSIYQPPVMSSQSPPAELLQLNEVADDLRERAKTPGGVSFSEWADFAARMREGLDRAGIRATVDVTGLARQL